jgi:hypothetical protein
MPILDGVFPAAHSVRKFHSSNSLYIYISGDDSYKTFDRLFLNMIGILSDLINASCLRG